MKCWAFITDQSLHIYQSSADVKPLYVISLLNGLIRYNNDVPSNVQLIPKTTRLSHFTVKEEYSIVIQVGGACVDITEDNEESVTLILSSKEEMVSTRVWV